MFEVQRVACESEDLTQYTMSTGSNTNSGTIHFQDASLAILAHTTFT